MGTCFSSPSKAENPLHTDVRSKFLRPINPRSEGEVLESSKLKSFTFTELKNATRNFHRDSTVGEDGFCVVFKGWIDENTLAPTKPGTGMVIAVKKLGQYSNQGHKEWLTEINYLGQLHHPNFVRLIGYCLEDEHRLLVYEFMSRGSMDNHLFRRSTNFQPLSWAVRMKVLLESAKGLAFLHSDDAKVIYRDFKTSNILLDLNYDAKLSGFGLARDGPTGNESHDSTRVVGEYGYVAPEYMATGHLSAKSDVYSFGVVLLEIICGKRAMDHKRPIGERMLVEWVTPYLSNKKKILRIMDPSIEGQYSMENALRTCQLLSNAFLIIPSQDQIWSRWSMSLKHSKSNNSL